MPHGPRLDTHGALHHVMVRGHDRQEFLHRSVDHEDLRIVRQVDRRIDAQPLLHQGRRFQQGMVVRKDLFLGFHSNRHWTRSGPSRIMTS